ncbi:hypothetical protein AB6A40_006480 [Gnathostoma spinigerum]|uniref:Protein disulfide-isomerase n=1 Tax=Gnathostoma spinigerum TaxID=75299 RepID=A0ABD6EKK5_9BILA
MSAFHLLLLFASIILCSVADADVVATLKDDDFDSILEEHELALVKFFAPWCGHCKRLKPEFEKAAKKLRGDDPPVFLAEVDCTDVKETCKRFDVSGYPTMKIFRNGVFEKDYDGPREAEGIVSHMRALTGPSSKPLNTMEEFKAFTSSDESVVIGFFEADSKLKDSYEKVTNTERDRFRFGTVTNKDIIAAEGFNDDIIVYVPKKLHNKFEENKFQYVGNYDTDKIKEFLVKESNGLCGVRTAGNSYQFEELPLFVAYYKVDYELNAKGSHYWRNRVLRVAKKFKRNAHFAVSNKDDFTQEIKEFGLEDRIGSDTPIVAALTKDGKFPMNMEFSSENLEKFVNDVLAGKAQSYLKSEPEPESQAGPVKVIVAKTFKKEIMESGKDVLMEFYAPWCGHCKELAPKYDELGEKLAKEDVIIAKMDATANDIPTPFSVKGYPTLYWVPKSDPQHPVLYTGAREVKDFIKFIAEHATDGLKGYTKEGKKKKKSEL